VVSATAANPDAFHGSHPGDDHDHHDDNTAQRRNHFPVRVKREAARDVLKRKSLRLREGHVHLDPGYVRLVDDRGFRHVAFQFAALGGEQMPARGVLTQNLAGPGDLESLRHGFPRLTPRN
jgi:hypothetical protein